MQGIVLRDIRNRFLLAAIMMMTVGGAGLFLAFTHFGYYRIEGSLTYQPDPIYWFGGSGLLALGGILLWADAIRPLRWAEGLSRDDGRVEIVGRLWKVKNTSETFPLLWGGCW